jgi:hypothetical protein
MSPPTLLRIERAAETVQIIAEYFCYSVIFGAIGLGWFLT